MIANKSSWVNSPVSLCKTEKITFAVYIAPIIYNKKNVHLRRANTELEASSFHKELHIHVKYDLCFVMIFHDYQVHIWQIICNSVERQIICNSKENMSVKGLFPRPDLQCASHILYLKLSWERLPHKKNGMPTNLNPAGNTLPLIYVASGTQTLLDKKYVATY